MYQEKGAPYAVLLWAGRELLSMGSCSDGGKGGSSIGCTSVSTSTLGEALVGRG